MEGTIFTGTMQTLARGIHGLKRQQDAIGANIANVNTPGYKRRTVDFAAYMRRVAADGGLALAQPDDGRGAAAPAAHSEPQVQREGGTSRSNSGNNVSVEHELLAMTRAQFRYQMLTQQLSSEIAMTKRAIRGGQG